MKLKGLTKLALSGVALAAVAATLGTSTYAWYVSNSKAEVSNVSGQSNTAAAGSLLINKLQNTDDKVAEFSAWTNKLAYTDLTFANATALDPVTKDGSGYTAPSGKEATGWHDVAGVPVATNKAFGYFMFGIETTDANKTKVNMTLGIENITGSTGAPTAQPQTAYGDGTGLPTAPSQVTVGNQFTEDFVYALKFDWHVEELTTNTAAKAATGYLTTNATSYDADSFQKLDLTAGYVPHDGFTTNGDAHAYYKAISEDNRANNGAGDIIGGEDDGASALTSGTTQFQIADSTKKYVLVFRYWLDGADAQCFDSCISQAFKLNIKLETQANNA